MAINSLDAYVGSCKTPITWMKNAARTTVAGMPFSVFELTTANGVLAVGNVTSGVVRTDLTAGCPTLPAFANGSGYITKTELSADRAMRVRLYDCLWSAGAFNANTNGTVTLSGQPAINGRLPANNYSDTELWYECVTAVTTAQSIAVTYVDQSGNLGHTTGTIATGVTPTLGRMIHLPLAVGDTGVQYVNTVVGTVSTAGTFNLHIMRQLCSIRYDANQRPAINDLLQSMVAIYDTSALIPVFYTDSTTTGSAIELTIEVSYA